MIFVCPGRKPSNYPVHLQQPVGPGQVGVHLLIQSSNPTSSHQNPIIQLNPTSDRQNTQFLCTVLLVTKNAHSDISETKRGIIDTLVSKRPGKYSAKNLEKNK